MEKILRKKKKRREINEKNIEKKREIGEKKEKWEKKKR